MVAFRENGEALTTDRKPEPLPLRRDAAPPLPGEEKAKRSKSIKNLNGKLLENLWGILGNSGRLWELLG